MKKLLALILALTLFCALCACGKTAEPAFADVSAKVAASVSTDSMTQVDAGYIKGSLGLEASAYTDACVMITNMGTAIDEYGVFKCADEKSAAEVETAVKAYIQMRIDTWMGYTPEELPKLENAGVETRGSYVMYAVMSDEAKSAALSAFDGCFKG